MFLGLTVGCATCHDHKFDPISQKDHYALEAFFNNTTERIMDNNRPDPPPIAWCRPIAIGRAGSSFEALRKSMSARMAAAHRAPNAKFDRWLQSAERAQLQDPLANAELLTVSADQESARVRRPGVAAPLPLDTGVTAGRHVAVERPAPLKFDGKSAMKLPGLELTGSEPFSMAAWVYMPEITLHPGQTGGTHALMIAGQLTAGDAEAKPAVPPRVGSSKSTRAWHGSGCWTARAKSFARRRRITSR